MHAIVLADRLGRELWPLTEKRPVCLLPIANKPLLHLTLEELLRLGICRATIICSQHAALVSSYFGSGYEYGMQLQYMTVGAPCSVEYGVKLARLTPDEEWFAVRGDILRPYGFLEEALLRGADAAKSSIFTAMGIVIPGRRGEVRRDIRWKAICGGGAIDPLSIEGITAYHRCNMKALEDDIADFIFPDRPTAKAISINQQSVVLAPFIDRRTVIGRDCLVEHNVVLGAGTIIGDSCIIGNGASIRESVILPGSRVEAMKVEQAIIDGSRIYDARTGAFKDLSGGSLGCLKIARSHVEFALA